MKVLEVGCGGGAITQKLIKNFNLSHTIIGVDFDARATQIAKQRKYPGAVYVEFHQLDVTQSNLETLGSDYDFIYCHFILSHLQHPDAALMQLRDLLKPNGKIAVEGTYFAGHFSTPRNPVFDRDDEHSTLSLAPIVQAWGSK